MDYGNEAGGGDINISGDIAGASIREEDLDRDLEERNNHLSQRSFLHKNQFV